MTVNGKQVTVTAPPRMTLADALRDRLGLKGTHLGCEHGICGMCTVLVDGQAARSCLLFACQLDGAEVLTVEGLGRPGELHPLQQAFGRHHALQCGFCTPGFLLSAYDLLRHRPEVTRGRARRGAVRRPVPLHRLPEHPQRRRRGRPHPPRRPPRPSELSWPQGRAPRTRPPGPALDTPGA